MFNPMQFYDYSLPSDINNDNKILLNVSIVGFDIISMSRTFTIMSRVSGTYSVKWGDSTNTLNTSGDAYHLYPYYDDRDVYRDYEIEITGDFTSFIFGTSSTVLGHKNYFRKKNFVTNGEGLLKNLIKYKKSADIIDGSLMFTAVGLETISEDITFPNLEDGEAMFMNNKLTKIPDNMTLNNLTNGEAMFSNGLLTYLPENMTLSNLTNGKRMFYSQRIVTLPDNMTLNNLTNGESMFQSFYLETLSSDMTLNNLINGKSMFSENSLITDLPSAIKLSSLENGEFMFKDVTINKVRYSQLLIDMESTNPNSNVPFDGGNSKYDASALSARAALVSRGWTITDGGYEA